MISNEYINETSLLGDIVEVDPVRYKNNENKTPVINAVIETVRTYRNGLVKQDRHKLALFGDRAHDFEDTVFVGDKVFVRGYIYNRRRFIEGQGDEPDVQITEATVTVEEYMVLSQAL